MPEYTNEQEWRDLILREVRDLREDFHNFQLEVVAETAENRGEAKAERAGSMKMMAIVSLLVSSVVEILAAIIKGHHS